MIKFQTVKQCSKCKEQRFYLGVDRFKRKYHKSSIDEELNTCEDVESLFQREHIDVTCSSCGYIWIESTEDFDEEEYNNPSDMVTITRLEYEQMKKRLHNTMNSS